MRVLFLGDVVGKKGREVIRDFLPKLKEEYKPDFTIINAENAAHGKGLTFKLYKEILSYGADCLTLGNHAYSKKEIIDYIDDMDKLIFPGNHILNDRSGYRIFEINNEKIAVINLLGRAMQEDFTTDPYVSMNKMLAKIESDYILVDFHAEATAEKRLFVEYYKNKVNAVLGTHTHVQTADEQLIDNVGFISDVGMCGPFYSIIGRDINECIARTIYNEKTRYTISESDPILCACYLEFAEGVCKKIKRIQIRP